MPGGERERESERARERDSPPLDWFVFQFLSSCPSLNIVNVYKCRGGMPSFSVICSFIMVFCFTLLFFIVGYICMSVLEVFLNFLSL